MTQNARPNRRTRRFLERGHVMSQEVPTSWAPIDRARGLRHKSLQQPKQAAKVAAAHGFSK